jgi:hypothetical protein
MVDTGYIIITITCKKQKPGMKINQLIREFFSGLLIVNRSGASGFGRGRSMTAYKLLVIISYFLRSCFAPTDIFALRQIHPCAFSFCVCFNPRLSKLFLLILHKFSQFHKAFPNQQQYRTKIPPIPGALKSSPKFPQSHQPDFRLYAFCAP